METLKNKDTRTAGLRRAGLLAEDGRATLLARKLFGPHDITRCDPAVSKAYYVDMEDRRNSGQTVWICKNIEALDSGAVYDYWSEQSKLGYVLHQYEADLCRVVDREGRVLADMNASQLHMAISLVETCDNGE